MSEERRILLADADSAVRRSATSILKATGYAVTAVGGFDKACSVVDNKPIDLALVGLNLGDGPSGFVLLRELRSRGSRFPIVVIAATAEPEDILAAFRLGASDVLLKPLHPSELLCIVDREMGLGVMEAAVRSGLSPSVTGEHDVTKDEKADVSASQAQLAPIVDDG